jgi:L-lactate dehydrogenase complex protein LldG
MSAIPDSRERVLAKIRDAIAGAVEGGAASQRSADFRRSANLDGIGSEKTLKRFMERLNDVGGEARILQDEEAAVSVLRGLIGGIPAGGGVLTADDPELLHLAVPRLIAECGARRIHPESAPLSEAEQAELGITTAVAGIADTGTILLRHTAATGRLAALLAPVHIALLRKQTIYPDKITYLHSVRDANAELGADPLTWVTGPSLTADIEKVLVRGAHGPRRVVVLIYG